MFSTFLQSAVTYAGSSWARASSRPPKIEALQAPARRLARTIIVLGQEEGVPFGLKAFNAIRTAAAACLGDPHRMLLWWSNVVTLRWSLWALMGRGGTGGGAHFSWLSDPMMPALLQLEQALFDDLVDNLWTNVLLRAAKDSLAEEKGLRGRSLSRTMSNGSSKSATPLGAPAPGSAADGWTDGGAVAHWLRGLREVEQALTCPGRPLPAPRPLVALARRQALARILQRLDAALFAALVSDGAGGRSSPGALDPALLPFQRGPLTFGTGVELKMAAGRLANWAADVGLREGAPPAAPPSPDSTAATSPSGELRLFAQLRAAADLLMMPKGSLSDAEVRRTVAPSLSVDAICQVLQRYQPDDSSAERFSPAILNQLRREETPGNGAAASRGHFAAVDVYEAPAEDVLLNEGVIQPLSLELSADSDDELAAMEERAGGDSRFQLLRELWGGAGGRP